MYTDEKTTQIVIAMLKAYGIKNVVASPGTRNCGFVASIQTDAFFSLYSVVDERSAMYFATGLAFEANEPVVVCCTGATASRNYLSGLTEAFHRRLPVIALTFGHEYGNPYNLTPQHVDRSVSQNDVKICSVRLPKVTDNASKKSCELMLNVALTKCMNGRRGPVHIDVLYLGRTFTTAELPQVNRLHYLSVTDMTRNLSTVLKELNEKKVGLFIGSHARMTPALTQAISTFAERCHAPVFVDHTSSYHGRNKVLIAQICDVMLTENRPNIMIDLGGISGQYSLSRLFAGADVWRIGDMDDIEQRAGTLKYFFDCDEEWFFTRTVKALGEAAPAAYHEQILEELDSMPEAEPPFSEVFVAQHLSRKIPAGSALHVSILNSLRSINFFRFDENVDISCNVGGFGIDGAVSTLVGQSVADRNRLYFGQIGDLAFFYDMNVIGNRHLSSNLRILMVNNNVGAEFRINPWLEKELGKDRIEPFIAARGHNGMAREWVKSCGFEYMTASGKEEFVRQLDEFCNPDPQHFNRPVFFEVFTRADDETAAIQGMARKTTPGHEVHCSAGVRLVSCLIPGREARHKFRRDHSK